MPVYIHHANLIVNKKAVAEHYKGGTEKFRKDFSNDNVNFQEDNELFSLAGMNPDEFPEERLIAGGLHFDREKNTSTDYVIVSRYAPGSPLLWEANWLRASRVYAYHIHCSPELKERTAQAENMTMEDAQRIFESGGNPFEVIR